MLARNLCSCCVITCNGAGNCSPVLERTSHCLPWPSLGEQLYKSLPKCLCFPLLLPLREFLFGEMKEDNSSWGKAGYGGRVLLSCMKSLISVLKYWECWVSSCWAAWASEVIGAFATRGVKEPLRVLPAFLPHKYFRPFSLISWSAQKHFLT